MNPPHLVSVLLCGVDSHDLCTINNDRSHTECGRSIRSAVLYSHWLIRISLGRPCRTCCPTITVSQVGTMPIEGQLSLNMPPSFIFPCRFSFPFSVDFLFFSFRLCFPFSLASSFFFYTHLSPFTHLSFLIFIIILTDFLSFIFSSFLYIFLFFVSRQLTLLYVYSALHYGRCEKIGETLLFSLPNFFRKRNQANRRIS
jgi:hypothetical protein